MSTPAPTDAIIENATKVTETPVAEGTSDQVVTPWDVEGAVVDGKQVRPLAGR